MSNLKLSSQGTWITSENYEVAFKVEPVWPFHLEASIRIEIAKRIVACVNACEGISTENLTDNVPLKQGLTGLNQRIRDAEAQRDDLLAALEKAFEMRVSCHPEWEAIARAAIARVKGGAV